MIKRKKATYNYLGLDISDIPIQIENQLYGYVDDNNIPHINWAEENDFRDAEGFDKRYRPIENSTDYVLFDYVLPSGILICRYGFEGGRFTTLKGTEYKLLGLPYKKETIEYHEYLVNKDLTVQCMVDKGVVAPMFSSPGGGIQFKHKQPIFLEIEDGFLKEDFSWIQKNV